MTIWFYSLASVVAVSLVSLVGVVILPFGGDSHRSLIRFLVSFSVGGLFGDAFIHLIPETYRELGAGLSPALFVILGILVFFVLEKLLCWRHCHIPTTDDHPHNLAVINIVGDALHNFLDGVIIGASYQVSTPIGLTTTLAVVLHEIPQEIGDFGILLYSGLSRRRALWFNFLSATTAVLGAVVILFFGPRLKNYTISLLPIAAGGFIYLAGSDLIPELKKETGLLNSLVELLAILLGLGLMAALTLVN